MKKLILHIGIAKTETSMIQTSLAKLADTVLSESGFMYPNLSDIDCKKYFLYLRYKHITIINNTLIG